MLQAYSSRKCTKNAYFSDNSEFFMQPDAVARRSPLGLVIVGIHMVELKKNILPKV